MAKIIQCDTRQKMGQKHHKMKEKYFESKGYKLVHSKMLVGDYQIPGEGSVAVDTKQSLTELYGNLIQQHDRFHNECVLAKDCGIKLYIVVENKEGIRSIKDVETWKNPQMIRYWKSCKLARKNNTKEPKKPASNIQLMKIMCTMQRDYGVEFIFVPVEKSGEKVLELLTDDNI